MSSEDQVRPYHAKKDASGQEAADAVAAVLKHAEERDKVAKAKTAPRKQPRWMLPLGINLAVFAVYLLIAPPDFVTLNQIEGPSLAKQEQDMRAAMYMQAQRIEGYRMNNGALPTAIEDIGSTPYQGMDYVPTGNAFRLIATVGESTVVYDSSSPDPSFEQSVVRAMTGAGG